VRERFRFDSWFVVDEAIEQADFSCAQREGWRRVCMHPTGRLAVLLDVNAVAEKYITHQMDNGGMQDETWVKDRLNELSTQASAARKALEDYSRNRKDTADSAATIDKLAAAAESSKSANDNFRHVLRQTEATQQQSLPVFEASLVSRP
jgi:hypothetical protein